MKQDADKPAFSATDHAMMARALRLAERGAYTTKPNPMVGAKRSMRASCASASIARCRSARFRKNRSKRRSARSCINCG